MSTSGVHGGSPVSHSDSEGEEEEEDAPTFVQYKVIVLGDGAVGKTSLVQRFTKDNFQQSYKQTIGLDFFARRISLPENVHANLQIWDIGGQQLGSAMLDTYLAGSHAILLVYDITNFQSFRDLEDWLYFVKQTFSKAPKMPYVGLIGNKMDLTHIREVKYDRHVRFAQDNGLHPFLASAKTGDQVDLAFFKVAADLSGIALTMPEMEVQKRVVAATVVEYALTDSATEEARDPRDTTAADTNTALPTHKKKPRKCTIQ